MSVPLAAASDNTSPTVRRSRWGLKPKLFSDKVTPDTASDSVEYSPRSRSAFAVVDEAGRVRLGAALQVFATSEFKALFGDAETVAALPEDARQTKMDFLLNTLPFVSLYGKFVREEEAIAESKTHVQALTRLQASQLEQIKLMCQLARCVGTVPSVALSQLHTEFDALQQTTQQLHTLSCGSSVTANVIAISLRMRLTARAVSYLQDGNDGALAELVI